MKVLLCDPLNTQNNFYVYTGFLRKIGVDAHLLIGTDDLVPEGHRTTWQDGKAGQPDWVHKLPLPYFLPYQHPIAFSRELKQVVKLAQQFDVIACSGLAPIWMALTGKPYVFISYGSDLDQMATQGWSGAPEEASAKATGQLARSLIQHALAWSLRKARASVVAPYQVDTARRLGLHNIRFMPHVVDTSVFRPRRDPKSRKELRDRLGGDIVLFHPARHVWLDTDIADCKGNDKVLRAFQLFVRRRPKAKLLLVNKGWDVASSRGLCRKLGIEDSVVWMEPVDKQEMARLYNSVDIVLGQFTKSVLTLVAIEAMACGAPVITSVPAAGESFYAAPPPVLNADSLEGIYDGLMDLTSHPTLRTRAVIAGHKWVNCYCAPEASIPVYADLLKEFSR